MSPPIRQVALSLFVGMLLIGAGCSTVQDNDEPSTKLLLVNQDNTDHAVVIEILKGGRETYATGTTIDAESEEELESFNQTGDYDVKVTVDGNSTTLNYTFTEDGSPATTTIGIDNTGNVTIGT